MHPVIRILCLIIAAAFLARASWREVAVLGGLVALLMLSLRFRHWRALLAVLRRLRFFFLSIAIVYGWFTPGEPVWPALSGLSPSWQGLEEGLLRVAALVVLVGAVRLMLEAADRPAFIAGLRWWARPLRPLGVDPERLALRLVLTLEAVPRLREVVAAQRLQQQGLTPIRRIGAFAGGVFSETLAAAERAELPVVAVPALPAPAPLQWLAPLALAAVLWVA